MNQPRRTLWLAVAGCSILFLCAVGLCACTALLRFSERDTPSPSGPTIWTEWPTATPAPFGTPTPLPDRWQPLLTPLPTPSGGEALADLLAAEVPQRDLRLLAQQFRPDLGPIPQTVRQTPRVYQLDDVETFWVSNHDTNAHFQIRARLRYITEHLYVWVEEGVSVNARDLRASADRFEAITYSLTRGFFGSEWTPGVDADPRLHILNAHGLGDTIAGYYSSADEYARQAQPYSNEREMFYVNIENMPPNTWYYDSVLAHELQHMIHWHQDRNETTWVNEGMSELAAELNGYDRAGGAFSFTNSPGTQLNTWTDNPHGNDAHYAGAYLFMTYFLDRFGDTLTRAVVASDRNGMAGFDAALAEAGRAERFDGVFADWVVANLLDDAQLLDGRFAYRRIDPQLVTPRVTYSTYPNEASGLLYPYSSDYAILSGSGGVTIEFAGDTSAPLFAANAHSGRFVFWGQRTDDAHATLTRAFDLTGLTAATLEAWVWYDLEGGFDYAYATVSTDGGETWAILPGRYTTDENPVGNGFGHGHTGKSGGDSDARWVQERYDLSPFAGRPILVRFQYVTDDAVNYPGWVVDDVAVPELDYFEDFEAGDGGWEAAGFVRTDNVVPVRWLVQVVERIEGYGDLVRRLEVGADGRGVWTVAGLGNRRDAVLIISPLAPITTEPSTFEYTLRRP